jgi:hypothetical protein
MAQQMHEDLKISAITLGDYEKFFSKLQAKSMTPEILKAEIPETYHEWVNVTSSIQRPQTTYHRAAETWITVLT